MTQNKAPEQGGEKELTPMGELIKFIDDNYEPGENEAADLIRQDATSLLEAEKDLSYGSFEAGKASMAKELDQDTTDYDEPIYNNAIAFFTSKYRQQSPTPNNNSSFNH